ncbi:MAG: MFS transporter [Alphaproteobacteria bacterium]|nr:MFS transporter [Alphaproteobacteria bacterium]
MNSLHARQLSLYSLLAIPLAFGSLPLYLFMPDFYAREMGVSLAALGTALLCIRLFDAVQDPVFGLWARKLHGRNLRLAMVGLLAALAVSLLSLSSPSNAVSPLLWFVVMMLLSTSALSFVQILYQSGGALWSDDYHTRTRITAWREGFGLLGVIVAVSLVAILRQKFPERDAFLFFGMIFCVLLALAGWAWCSWAKRHSRSSPFAEKTFSITLLTQHRRFFGIWFTSQLASAIPVVLVLFFIRDRLQLEAFTGLFLALYFFSGALGMPIWRWVEKHRGKRIAWASAMALSIVAFLWAFGLGVGDMVGYALVCIASGLALGGEMALPPSLLADRISSTGDEAQTPLLFGFAGFIGKASLALASGIALPFLSIQGYVPGQENSPESITQLAAAYTILPCIIKTLALLLLLGDRTLEWEKPCLSAY